MSQVHSEGMLRGAGCDTYRRQHAERSALVPRLAGEGGHHPFSVRHLGVRIQMTSFECVSVPCDSLRHSLL